MRDLTVPSELVNVHDTIDAIARDALEEARRLEEAERYRTNPGPVVPPPKVMIAPKWENPVTALSHEPFNGHGTRLLEDR